MDVKEEIGLELGRLGCRYAFYFRRRGAEPVQAGSGQPFVAASVIKVAVLFAWAHLERAGRVDRGEMCELDLEPPVAGAGLARLMRTRRMPFNDVLLMMIALSDNLCANLVIRRMGMARLNSLFRESLGLRDTVLNRVMMDEAARREGRENEVSARDCIQFYRLRDALTPSERSWIDGMLSAAPNTSLWLRDFPPDSVALSHKGGDLEGILHDWAYTPEADLFLLTQGVKDYDRVYAAFGRLGRLLLPGSK